MHLLEFPIRVSAVARGTAHRALRGAVSHAGEFGERHLVARFFVGQFDERSKPLLFRLVIVVHGGQIVTPDFTRREDTRPRAIRLQGCEDGGNLRDAVEVRMPNRTVVRGVLVLAFGAIVAAPLLSSRASHVDIVGHVYDAAGRGTPVAGAVVSNDWDSTTSTTNTQGEFHMRVRRVAADEWIKFSAWFGDTAGCHRQVGPLESRTVEIVLNDPTQRVRCL